ncbi:hypothetical protein D3X11_03425 [Streptococcus sp. X16XC17]|uniref:hypothetical protein n=1 Tax=unclassified Streptococcus TaxID=2608887 RepID=UPI00069DB98E|nr:MULTISPECIES: hypothetical protein [unclassified Streptococcus]TCD46462.1 hypothetical protein D3X11_03425 [Streptococcus sp. X16XC17]
MEPIDATKPFGDGNAIYDFVEYDLPGKPELETVDMFGPYITETVDRSKLSKKQVLMNHPEIMNHIHDINSYYLLSFVAQDGDADLGYAKDAGLLKVGQQTGKTVTYLVKKGTNLHQLGIKAPELVASPSYFFKKWLTNLPEDGVLKQNLTVTAAFRHEKHRDTPAVLTGDLSTQNVHSGDYALIKFTTFNFGKLEYNNMKQAGFHVHVRNDLAWKEALAKGFSFPTSFPDNDQIEFIHWTGSLDYPTGQVLNQKVSTGIFLAKFGLKRPIIGAYVPSNSEKPLDSSDTNRPHTNSVTAPYDKNKYITIVIDAGPHAHLRYNGQNNRQFAFVVRKRTKRDTFAGIMAGVQILPEEGYVARGHHIALSNMSEEIKEGIYQENVVAADAANPNPDSSKQATDQDGWINDDELLGTSTGESQKPQTDKDSTEPNWISDDELLAPDDNLPTEGTLLPTQPSSTEEETSKPKKEIPSEKVYLGDEAQDEATIPAKDTNDSSDPTTSPLYVEESDDLLP